MRCETNGEDTSTARSHWNWIGRSTLARRMETIEVEMPIGRIESSALMGWAELARRGPQVSVQFGRSQGLGLQFDGEQVGVHMGQAIVERVAMGRHEIAEALGRSPSGCGRQLPTRA